MIDERPRDPRPGFFGGLSPEVVRLGLVSFFADVSSEMLQFVFAGYSVAALAKPVIALAQTWPLVLVARTADRFGKAMRTSPRDALLADYVKPEERARAFGWHRAMDSAGAVVGPLVALLLISATNNNLRLVIALTVIPGLMGALLVLTVRESRGAAKRAAAGERPAPIPIRQMPRPFLAYLAAWAPFALVNSSVIFLILRAKQLGYSTTLTILLYTTYNVVYALSSPVFGHLADWLGRRQVLIGGLGVFALVYLGFAVVRVPGWLWGLFAVYGLYIAATDGVGKAYAIELVPASVRATAVGLLGTVTGVATLVASTAAGVLWQHVGPWAAFAFGAAGALVAGVVLLVAPVLRHAAAA
jgi:MFS family permease